jgi:hypothetical protein
MHDDKGSLNTVPTQWSMTTANVYNPSELLSNPARKPRFTQNVSGASPRVDTCFTT